MANLINGPWSSKPNGPWELWSKAAGIGEVDGNEFGAGEAVLFAYGRDADALYGVMEPGPRALPFRPGARRAAVGMAF
ncbi:hypothetical protein [Streptomyces sp. ISL-10]|uniref:hypothetical protein n=1 Tax=Streptomyces sp. ISL-10 TaxID=2819172 RepID=UPI002035933B|nr:hypothetical protein [Streptomyces sp. ISL-10]